MGFIAELWAAILLAAVVAWIVQAIVWTVMPHRNKEWSGVPEQDRFRGEIRAHGLTPGYYMIPYTRDSQEMKSEEFARKMKEGPVATLHVWRRRRPMGLCMGLSFAFNLIASATIAYIAWNALEGRPGVDYLKVFQITGTAAFVAYVFALVPGGIWFGKPLRSMVYDIADGLVVALLTGGVFGWLWPSAADAAEAASGLSLPG